MKATPRHDAEVIPEVAMRPSQEYTDYHTGRGGEGNVQRAGQEKSKVHEGLADKLKHKLFKSKPKA